MNEPHVLAVIWCTGDESYFTAASAAARSLLLHTDLDVAIVSPHPERVAIVQNSRLRRITVTAADFGRRADPFLGKFTALEAVLRETTHEVLLMLDSDCCVSRPFKSDELLSALGSADIALAEQRGIRGTTMARPEFLEHYLRVSLPGVLEDGTEPEPGSFRYFNTGVVLGTRTAWTELLTFATRVSSPDRTLEVEGNMVADQDIIQVWLHTRDSVRIAELESHLWNACELWCDVQPDLARIIHRSNFCQGPSDDLLAACLPLPGVSVVIVAFQSRHCIESAVRSAYDAGADEVIVIDNASTDGSADSARISGARVLCLEANTGFANAANIGLLAAERHVVVVMNPDVFLTPLAVEALKTTAESRANVLVSPWQETPSLGILGMQAHMSRLHLIRAVLENAGASSGVCGVIHALDRRLSAGRPGWLLGGCIAATRDNWYAHGGFDISYFLYMEDVDLSDRWRGTGGTIAIVDAVVRHDMGTGSSIENAHRVSALTEARVEYGRRKYGERFSSLLLRLAS